jgi:hypothetical protein
MIDRAKLRVHHVRFLLDAELHRGKVPIEYARAAKRGARQEDRVEMRERAHDASPGEMGVDRYELCDFCDCGCLSTICDCDCDCPHCNPACHHEAPGHIATIGDQLRSRQVGRSLFPSARLLEDR